MLLFSDTERIRAILRPEKATRPRLIWLERSLRPGRDGG